MEPSTQVETDKSITTETEAEYAVNGLYHLLRTYEYYGARFTYYGDATGEDMQSRNDTKRVAKYYLYDLNAVTASSSFWLTPYQVIRNANTIIAFCDKLSEEELTSRLKQVKGEAYALRAMAHFDLVKIYGMPYTKDQGASLGVPIVTERLPIDAKPSRNTVADVYDQIISDLKVGVENLSKSRVDGKLNWYGAQLLLARAYQYMGNNSTAYQTVKDLIDAAEKDKNYSLWTNSEYADAWKSAPSGENFLTLINNAEEISSSKEFIGYLMHRSGYDDISLSSDYINLLDEDPDDVRHKIIDKYRPKDFRFYLLKYMGPDNSYKYADIPVLRFSEAYLIAAEAAVKLGDNKSALKYLNKIVQRANPEKEVTGEVTLERVLKERRKELVGEGHRLFDAMRNNQKIERKGASHNSAALLPETRTIDWNYYKIILPVPKSEMNVNKNLKQNPGYDS